MRGPLLLLVFSVLFCSMFLFLPAYAATSIGFESYRFSASVIYQGASGVYVDLNITNNGNSSVVVHGAFVHFDWQLSNESFMVGSQSSGEPYDLGKELQPAEYYVFRIPFSVPGTVSEGGHLFYFRVYYNDGSQVQWNPREKNPYAELTVHNLYEREYAILRPSVEEQVAQAQDAGFISPEAQSLAQHAEELLSDAHSFAAERDWGNSFSYLRASSRAVDQAYAAEGRFQIYLIVGSIVGVGAIIGVVLFVRRRRRNAPQRSSARKAAKRT